MRRLFADGPHSGISGRQAAGEDVSPLVRWSPMRNDRREAGSGLMGSPPHPRSCERRGRVCDPGRVAVSELPFGAVTHGRCRRFTGLRESRQLAIHSAGCDSIGLRCSMLKLALRLAGWSVLISIFITPARSFLELTGVSTVSPLRTARARWCARGCGSSIPGLPDGATRLVADPEPE